MNSITSAPPKLLDQVRSATRYRHFALATEKAYIHWVRAFVRFHGLRHPREMGAHEVEAFLTHLAEARQVSPSTHKQALRDLGDGGEAPLVQQPLPVVGEAERTHQRRVLSRFTNHARALTHFEVFVKSGENRIDHRAALALYTGQTARTREDHTRRPSPEALALADPAGRPGGAA